MAGPPPRRRRGLALGAAALAALLVVGVVAALALGGDDEPDPTPAASASTPTPSGTPDPTPSATAAASPPRIVGPMDAAEQTLYQRVATARADTCQRADPLERPENTQTFPGATVAVYCVLPLGEFTALVAYGLDGAQTTDAAYAAYHSLAPRGTTCAAGGYDGTWDGGALSCEERISSTNGELSRLAWTDTAAAVYYEAYGPPGDLDALISTVFEPVCGCTAP